MLSTDDMLAIAEERVAAGDLQGSHFPPNYLGRSAEDLLRRLLDLRPVDAAPVFTHGDPSLPNFLFEGGRVTGFIDVGLAAVSDPWRDLGIAARSISWNIGGRWVRPFLAAYGAEPDWPRLEWLRLMDEFVMTRPVQANLRRDFGAIAP